MASLLIADHGGFNEQRVPITGVSRSWAVGTAGTLSAELRSSDLVTYGLNGELRGHWITVHDTDAGTWSGVITDVQPNGDGTTEIAAEDFGALFAKRSLPRRKRGLWGPAGSVALQAITEASREFSILITDRSADDIGLAVSFDLDGGDLRDALDSMASETGQDWWVDHDTRAFRWGVKGSDLTGTSQLIASRHIIEWRLPQTLDPVINDLTAYPVNDRYQMRQSVRVEQPESIAAVGRRQGSAGIASGSHAIHIRSRAVGMVEELASQGIAIEFDLVNEDRCFAWFREGDTICVLLPSVSLQLAVRVTARALDDRQVMSVSADVVTMRALP